MSGQDDAQKAAEQYYRDWIYGNVTDAVTDQDLERAFLAGAAWATERAAKLAEGEVLIDVSEPGETKRQYGTRVARAIAAAIRKGDR